MARKLASILPSVIITMKNSKYTHTAKALAEYDAGEADRRHFYDLASTSEEFWMVWFGEQAAIRQVQDAFYEDTKAFNSLGKCRVTTLDYLRFLVYNEEQHSTRL